MHKLKHFIIAYCCFFLPSCEMFSAGHGGFMSYSFEIKKKELEGAIIKVIETDSNFYREPEVSQEYKDIYKEITKERNKENPDSEIDTNYVDYYNDGENYVTIKLKNTDYKFTFRYIGDEEYWNNSPNSQFYIVYMRDEYNRGGGYKDKLEPQFIDKLTNVFETEFVQKVSKELGIPFSEEK
ncbi:hypothetical protein [Pedobacter sp. N23S346]|uniref:hypothetical protein n=1 Tax=Pedobacter sp. N23S346 TaxID=3402750 RepID=UPI003ACA6F22